MKARIAGQHLIAANDRSVEIAAQRWRSAIVCRMQVQEAESVDDSEIVRTLSPCVCGGKLIPLAKHLRDTGRLIAADVVA